MACASSRASNCDFLVRLPQAGSVESLNVSVACGMLLYEAVKQRDAKRVVLNPVAGRY